MMTGKNEYCLNVFRTCTADLEKIVGAALAGGGDWCDLYFENTVYTNLILKDGEVTSGGLHTDYGVGIRVLCGEKTGYAYSESTALGDMMAAAKAAAAISAGSGSAATAAVTQGTGSKTNQYTFPEGERIGATADRYPMAVDWADVSQASLLPFLKRVDSMARSRDSRIVKVVARLATSRSDIMMYNSAGQLTSDCRPMCSTVVQAIFSQNGMNESKAASRSFRMGAEMITDALADELVAELVDGIDARFEARRPSGGTMPVVMAAGASGILLHEAMGHAFEADFNRKGQSIFSDMMGKQICERGINIVDDATIAGSRGSLNYDDEGVPGQKTYMVRDGILTSYLHDRISAAHYGVAPTGNGRRESFRYNPIPRMRTTYMESGDADPEAIIHSVKKGIYVNEFANGQVKIGEGDFTFYVKSGFLIEDGRLTTPVKDINVIGNGPQALKDIEAVGNDLLMDNGTWTCGKEQSVAVSIGIPTVLIRSLTVGGE